MGVDGDGDGDGDEHDGSHWMFVGHKMVFFRTFSEIFSKENLEKSYNRVLGGVGVRVTKGGYQILLGDCHTITIPGDSIS